MTRRWTVGMATLAALAVLFAPGTSLHAQGSPIAPKQPRGLGVSPSFNGWYENPDGTYTLSFGYINRNTEEIITIPVGSRNFVEPGNPDQGQPTYFLPGRQFGSFTVKVPADFGPNDRVVWTLEANGERYSIPGGLIQSYEIPALYNPSHDDEGVLGSRPPVLVLEPEGAPGRGPLGTRTQARARVGQPLKLTVSAWDEHDNGPTNRAITLRWYKHRGPGEVAFDTRTVQLRDGTREGVTTVTFSEPGEYVLLVQAHHSRVTVTSAGHAQCCWTNGYVEVQVAP